VNAVEAHAAAGRWPAAARSGWVCRACREPVTVRWGDPEAGGTVLHADEEHEGDVGHVAAPVEAALAWRTAGYGFP
jgi:hypothetical protein